MAKLSDRQKKNILAKWHTGEYSKSDLAKLYKVDESMIRKMLRDNLGIETKTKLHNSKNVSSFDGSSNGFVYVVKIFSDNINYYKIGVARNLESRIKSFKTSNPLKLSIEIAFYVDEMYMIEKYFHCLFEDKRHHNEWFVLSDEDLELIKNKAIYGINN